MQHSTFYKIFCYSSVIVGAYVTADFVMGVFHWFKDTYFGPYTPIIGKRLIWGSRLHHIKPRHVIEFSNRELFISSAKWSLIWMLPLLLVTGFNLFWSVLFLTIGLNDVIHKYAHMLDHERPKIVTFLQKIYVIQSYEEHHQHHISPHEINYCPITPFLNKPLEKINFWRRLENIIEKSTGIKPRTNQPDFIEDETFPAGIKFIESN